MKGTFFKTNKPGGVQSINKNLNKLIFTHYNPMYKKTSNVRVNVTVGRVRVTTVVMVKQ